MKRFLLAFAALAVPMIAAAQTVAPRFESRTADNGARMLAGVETIRVGKVGMTLPQGMSLAVRLSRTGQVFACDALPCAVKWDTATGADGWQWVEILWIDPAAPVPEKVIDSLKVYVRNRAQTPVPVVIAPAAGVAPPAPASERPSFARGDTSPVRAVATDTPPSNAPRLAGAGGATPAAGAITRRGRSVSPRLLSLPETVAVQTAAATVGNSDAPLSVPRVSVLCKSGSVVFLGLPDGGVAAWDETTKRGYVVRVPGVFGAVRALAAGDGVFYWTAGASDTVRCFRVADKTVTAFDAAQLPAGALPASPWIERLAVLGNRVMLMGGATTRVWEGGDSLKSLADVLPETVAGAYFDALTRCYIGASAGAKDALLVFATPNADGVGGSLQLFSGDGANPRKPWRDRGTVATTANLTGAAPHLSLTPVALLLGEKSAGYGQVSRLSLVSCADRNAPVAAQTVLLGVSGDYNASAPQSAETVSVGGSGIWWAQNGVVFHADSDTGNRECFLPWNGAGGTVTALLADNDGAFVATDKGVRRVISGKPGGADGYNGYVRVPLGDALADPQTDRDRKLLAGIEEWQGVPYRWGGATKSGTDCSGFVGAMHQSMGVAIPRTSKAMGETRQGTRVRDELRYGDTLVYPGHVALYLGNGRTAETVGGNAAGATGSVSKSTIWRRRDVIVKRFLP